LRDFSLVAESQNCGNYHRFFSLSCYYTITLYNGAQNLHIENCYALTITYSTDFHRLFAVFHLKCQAQRIHRINWLID